MIRSGLNMPTPAIPIPDLAVPYAAPAPDHYVVSSSLVGPVLRFLRDLHPNIIYDELA